MHCLSTGNVCEYKRTTKHLSSLTVSDSDTLSVCHRCVKHLSNSSDTYACRHRLLLHSRSLRPTQPGTFAALAHAEHGPDPEAPVPLAVLTISCLVLDMQSFLCGGRNMQQRLQNRCVTHIHALPYTDIVSVNVA